jgi:tetratricopeptide (TPR) repeat protein
MLTIIICKIKKAGILIPLAILVALVGCGKATNHVEVGQALLEQGKIEDAAIEFKKAIKRNPNSAEAHFGLGNTYVEKKELEDAALHYREAIKLDSKFVEAYKRLSETFIEMGAPDSYFEKKYNAIEEDPDDPIARIDLGVLYHKWDQTRNAITE